MSPSISHLVTCSTETNTLRDLLDVISSTCTGDDEVIILEDSSRPNSETEMIIDYFCKSTINTTWHTRELNNNYGEHKNFGNSLCKNDWIFQWDGDELPSEQLLLNIKAIVFANPDIDLFYIPRINDFDGVTPEHAKQWGWQLTDWSRPSGKNVMVVNRPDYQGRLYRRHPDIKWNGRLHEKIVGYNKYTFLPDDDNELYILHRKTIEKQIETNLRYNKEFSVDDNKGWSFK